MIAEFLVSFNVHGTIIYVLQRAQPQRGQRIDLNHQECIAPVEQQEVNKGQKVDENVPILFKIPQNQREYWKPYFF